MVLALQSEARRGASGWESAHVYLKRTEPGTVVGRCSAGGIILKYFLQSSRGRQSRQPGRVRGRGAGVRGREMKVEERATAQFWLDG